MQEIKWSIFVLALCAAPVLNAQVDERKIPQEEELRMKKEMLDEQQRMVIIQREHADRERDLARRQREHIFFDNEDDSYFLADDGNVFSFMGHQHSSQLILRNTFRGGSDETKGEFEIDAEAHVFKCMIHGRVRSGHISIRVYYPDGKLFKELGISPSAQVTFNQSNTIDEESRARYKGAWNYEVEADKAEGSYTLQLSTH